VRLAGVSALLTFVILCAFALAIGSLTVHRIRAEFNRQVLESATQLPSQLHFTLNQLTGRLVISPPLADFATHANHDVIRILSLGGTVIEKAPANAPSLGPPQRSAITLNGYRIVSVPGIVRIDDGLQEGQVIFQYGRPVSDTEATVKRVELFLLLGVLAGSGLALLAGMAIARRAMAPVALLTSAAAEIARTRDPSKRVPQPEAEDEVSELARTLDGMLRELDAARAETESTLARQRRFVADASHELRTPLTSVLANLELLAESLHGEEGDAARSALRSSQRMRRLVADLLLLARSDAGRVVRRERCDLAQLVVEAAAELGPVSDAHAETEAMLARQRRFVADASHELRTPLTSVLANLELLADRSEIGQLRGDLGEAARSALRSSRRMRRLVADLLLLARTDVPRDVAHEPVDLAQVALDAAAELGPLSGEHDLSIDALPAVVFGDHDELFRLTLNLIENALRHTPPGTAIRVSTGTDDTVPAGRPGALLVVEDDGPGVPAELAPTLFERFVRGAGDRGGSFGLGLAIVRAVAESHGGSVVLEPAHPGVAPPGARFTVRLPLAPRSDLHDHREDHRPAVQPVVDQLR